MHDGPDAKTLLASVLMVLIHLRVGDGKSFRGECDG